MIEIEVYEKLILYRNFRSVLKDSIASSFDLEHMKLIHQKLCRGLGHKDDLFKSGEIRVSKGAANLLNFEVSKMAPHLMASIDKHFLAKRAAYVMARIENMQPFHSLNSMVGKLYSHNLTQTAGFKIDWPNMDKERLSMALDSAKQGKAENLVKQIEFNLSPMYEHKKNAIMADRVAEYKYRKESEVSPKDMKMNM